MSQADAGDCVTRIGALDRGALAGLLARYGLALETVDHGAAIPGSYWGAPEAGLLGARLYARDDTPVHSVMHEACHYVCMTPERRRALDTDAGGDYGEENAVCYLQIVLADFLPGYSRAAMCADMDRWGYTFRLGSARAWFERDATDALEFLRAERILDGHAAPTWRLREDVSAA